MHILFFSDNFPPEVNAPATRTFEHTREWVKAGHQVTIVTCVPNFPQGKIHPGYKNKFWQSEVIDGIRIIRVWSYITPNEGFWKRTLDFISFMITSFLAGLFVKKVDLIIGTSPQFFTVVSAWLLSVVKRKPFIFELRDLWPESVRVLSNINKPFLFYLLEKLELFLYHRAAAIVAVTYSFREDLISRGVEECKISVISNGADLSKFHPKGKDEELINSLNLDKKFIVGYIGTIGLAHGLDTIVQVAKNIQEKDKEGVIQFLFVGDGAEKLNLKSRVKTLGLGNVTFIDSVSKLEIDRYWSILDVTIIHLKDNMLFKTVIPSKMFEAMAMGIPIIHAVEGESAQIISSGDNGLLISPENPDEMASAIKLLHSDKELRLAMGERGQVLSRQFDRHVLARKMLSVLQNVTL